MNPKAQEGMLYKRITAGGRVFDIYYGYYEEKDRLGKYSEPVPIFPNFQENPLYALSGRLFVTQMQDACEHFVGRDKESGCHGCRHYKKEEDLIGVCLCDKNKMN